jgi:aspartate racemase
MQPQNPPQLPRIGILGGMGPLASAEFAVKLVQATPATCDQEHFPTTLDSTPQVPDRPNFLFHGGPDPLPTMVDVIRRLEAAGCALITMPCNTVHHWYDTLSAQTHLPMMHIADAVAARLRQLAPGARRVGVLGGTVTCRMGIYSRRLGDAWTWIYPSDAGLETHLLPAIAAVKAGDLVQGRSLFLLAMQEMLAQKPDAIVLGCTEIPVVLTQADSAVPVIDSTEALALHTIAAARAIQLSEHR